MCIYNLPVLQKDVTQTKISMALYIRHVNDTSIMRNGVADHCQRMRKISVPTTTGSGRINYRL